MNNKKEFTEAMFFLAEVTGKNLSNVMFDFYYKDFEHSLEQATKAILEFAKDGKWPSINQIWERMGVSTKEPDNDEKARLLSQKVIEAIGKFGWPNPVDAEKWFGPVDWEIVTKFRPWPQICDVQEDELQTFNSQFREFAKAYMHNQKYENHLAINGKGNDVVKSLLDSKIQRLIDEIPF